MNILTNFFQRNEHRFAPIIPIQEIIDVEIGENLHLPASICTNLEMKQDKLDNPDLELGFGPIVEMSDKHIIIRMQKNDVNNIGIYYSLFDSLNYINVPYRNATKIR
jgi:hypothetical protein